ncbi:unnamed protein product [Amoebophrya sp. A25]|nr:unnamed protein product [Amoebophrya sp. A25]|eukprot:GSA25T00011747001.1
MLSRKTTRMGRRIGVAVAVAALAAEMVVATDQIVESCILTRGELMKKNLRNGAHPKLRPDMINDGFCDCLNGLDEPETSACAGLTSETVGDVQPNLFFCKNEGAKSKFVYSSQVSDGICDCCDTSDEPPALGASPACSNTCQEEGISYREQRAALEKEVAEALQIVDKHEASAKVQEQEWQEKLDNRDAAYNALVVQRDDLKVTFEAKNKAWLDEKGEQEAAPSGDAETSTTTVAPQADQAQGDKAAGASKNTVSEYAKWMDKNAGVDHGHGEKDHEDDEGEHDSDHNEHEGEGNDDHNGENSGHAKSPAEQAKIDAWKAYQDAVRKVDNFDAEEEDLRTKLEVLRKHRAFYSLLDRCLETHAAQYRYKVCFFNEQAQQDHTRLGRFSHFEGDNKMIFTGGDMCPGGPERNLHVYLQCGKEERILGIDEPDRCVYRAKLTHPALCKAASLANSETPDRPANYEL